MHTILPHVVRFCSKQQADARLFFSWLLRWVRRLSGDVATGPGLASHTTQLHAFAAAWVAQDPLGDVLERAARHTAEDVKEKRELQDPLRLEPHAAAVLEIALPDVPLVDDAPGLVYVRL